MQEIELISIKKGEKILFTEDWAKISIFEKGGKLIRSVDDKNHFLTSNIPAGWYLVILTDYNGQNYKRNLIII